MKNIVLVIAYVLVQCLTTDCLFASHCHRFCGLNGSKCMRKYGLCLCDYGWTGPNGVFITSGPNENRIIADYCITRCQYSSLYRNPNCTGLSTPPPLPTEAMTGESCNDRCGPNKFSGRCLPDNKCLCWWGRTGPNAMYVNAGIYKNRIVADNCNSFCRYNHVRRNPDCVASKMKKKCDPRCEVFRNGQCQSDGRCMCLWGWTGPNAVYVTKGLITRIKADYCDVPCHYNSKFVNPRCAKQTTSSISQSCDPRCEKNPGQGVCQSNGRCLCWWGWTGPNATYVVNGNLTNRIMADYCIESCHYTHDYLNASCASIPVPRECSVPPNSSTPLPCKPQCGAGVYHGKCLSNGRCLCWWGWTGPNSCFVDGGNYNNRIIADYCNEACHYTHDYRNNSCTYKQNESTRTLQLQLSNDLPSVELKTTIQPLNTKTITKTIDDSTKATLESAKTEHSTTTKQPITTQQPITTENHITAEKPITTEQLAATEEIQGLSLTAEQTISEHLNTKDNLTAKQHISTRKESSTTKQPIETDDHTTAATTDQQSSTTEQLPTTIKPPITTELPTRTEQQATTTRRTFTKKQQIATTQPQPDTTKPQLTTIEQELMTTEHLTTTEQQTTTSEPQPATTEQQSTFTEQKPMTTEHPTTAEQQPTTTQQQPSRTDQRPNTEQQSTTRKQQTTTTKQKPTTTEPQPPTTEPQPPTREPQPTTKPQPTTTKVQTLIIAKQQFTTKEEQSTSTEQLTSVINKVEATKTKKNTEPIDRGTVPSQRVWDVNVYKENIGSPSERNSIALTVGIIAIVCALTGLVFMLRNNMKCFKTRTGYRKLGEEAYFLNEHGTNHEF